MSIVPGEIAPRVADVGPQPPAPPRLIASDRRAIDPRRFERVIPPSLAAELGDAVELEHHRDTYRRWEQATRRVGDLRRRHAEALEHDREAEQGFASGKSRKLPEATAAVVELELTGAMRAVEVLEREVVAAGAQLFAASLEHVPAAERRLVARLEQDDDRVQELLEQAIAVLDERTLAAAGGHWLRMAQWEVRCGRTCRAPRAAGSSPSCASS